MVQIQSKLHTFAREPCLTGFFLFDIFVMILQVFSCDKVESQDQSFCKIKYVSKPPMTHLTYKIQSVKVHDESDGRVLCFRFIYLFMCCAINF